MGSRSSNTPTTTQSQYEDSRSVVDAGGGIAGTGNVWDQSQLWQQYTADNRSTVDSGNTTWQQSIADNRSNSNSGNSTWTSDSRDLSTTNWDASNSGNTTWTSDSRDLSNTTWNWDASDRSTTTLNVTDGGAVKAISDMGLAQSSLSAQLAQIMASSTSNATGAAVDAQTRAMSFASGVNSAAIDFAVGNNAAAFKSSADALGFVSDKFSDLADMTKSLIVGAQKQADSAGASVSAAYSSAATQANGNKTLTIAALAAVGLVAALVVFKKGS